MADILSLVDTMTKPNFTQIQLVMMQNGASASDYGKLKLMLEKKFNLPSLSSDNVLHLAIMMENPNFTQLQLILLENGSPPSDYGELRVIMEKKFNLPLIEGDVEELLKLSETIEKPNFTQFQLAFMENSAPADAYFKLRKVMESRFQLTLCV